MDRSTALAVLGLTRDDPASVRDAYREHLRRLHPDVNPDPDAVERTIRVTTAYRVLSSPGEPAPPTATQPTTAPPTTAPPTTAPPRPPAGPTLEVEVVDASTIAVHASREETLDAAIEAAHRLGEVAYLDPMAGLVEAIVEFVEAPTSSVVMSLQGRGTGVTEVFCTVEPLSGGDAPPADAVTRLVARTLATSALP